MEKQKGATQLKLTDEVNIGMVSVFRSQIYTFKTLYGLKGGFHQSLVAGLVDFSLGAQLKPLYAAASCLGIVKSH